MKNKIYRFLILILCFTFTLISLSCDSNNIDKAGDYIDWSKYCIVLSSQPEGLAKTVFDDFQLKYLKIVGETPTVFYQDKILKDQEHAIFFPGCEECLKMGNQLKPLDYSIVFSSGNIYIVAGTDSERDAIAAFTVSVLTETCEYKSGDVIEYKHQYRFSSLLLNNKEINDYVLFYEKDELSACHNMAVQLNAIIEKNTGIKLPLYESTLYVPEKNKSAILIGECGGISEGISEGVNSQECAYRIQDTTIAFYSYSNSLMLFYEFLNKLICPQIDNIKYGDAGKVFLENNLSNAVQINFSEENESASNTRVIVSGRTSIFSGNIGTYETYNNSKPWLIEEYPDIVILPNIEKKARYYNDAGGYWYNYFAKSSIINNDNKVVILSKLERYSYREGQYNEDYSWELLYDNVTEKNVLVVAICLFDEESKTPLQIEKIMSKVSELKEKHGDDVSIIIGITGNMQSSKLALDEIESKYSGYVQNRFDSYNIKDENKENTVPSSKEGFDNLIIVSANIDISSQKTKTFQDNDVTYEYAELNIN